MTSEEIEDMVARFLETHEITRVPEGASGLKLRDPRILDPDVQVAFDYRGEEHLFSAEFEPPD